MAGQVITGGSIQDVLPSGITTEISTETYATFVNRLFVDLRFHTPYRAIRSRDNDKKINDIYYNTWDLREVSVGEARPFR